jgi:hypothetical protein
MIAIRPGCAGDLPAVRAMDPRLAAWVFRRNLARLYRGRGARAWEFGKEATGYVVRVQVASMQRERGIVSALYEALVTSFRRAGVTRVRTLVDYKDNLMLSFFRTQGMAADPSLELELEIE